MESEKKQILWHSYFILSLIYSYTAYVLFWEDEDFSSFK